MVVQAFNANFVWSILSKSYFKNILKSVKSVRIMCRKLFKVHLVDKWTRMLLKLTNSVVLKTHSLALKTNLNTIIQNTSKNWQTVISKTENTNIIFL